MSLSRPTLTIATLAATGLATFTAALGGIAGLGDDLRAATEPLPAPVTGYELRDVAGPPAPEGTRIVRAGCDDRHEARDAATGVRGHKGL